MGQGSNPNDQHIGLPAACAVIYSEITGVTPDSQDLPGMQAILDDIAHTISDFVPVYASGNEATVPSVLYQHELREGKFLLGAHVFRATSGAEKSNLTLQRRDIYNAVLILRAAHITFRKPTIG